MTAFNKAWGVVKNENSCSKCGEFIHFQDEPFWSAGECRECWPEGCDLRATEVPFKPRSREDFPCDHNMELTDEDEVEGILYHTYTCSKCGESSTSSPS